jgi:hypothetical protein
LHELAAATTASAVVKHSTRVIVAALDVSLGVHNGSSSAIGSKMQSFMFIVVLRASTHVPSSRNSTNVFFGTKSTYVGFLPEGRVTLSSPNYHTRRNHTIVGARTSYTYFVEVVPELRRIVSH